MTEPPSDELAEGFLAGRDLTDARARRLAARLEREPDNAALHAEALGHYHHQLGRSLGAREPYLREYLWFVANRPGADLLAATLLPDFLIGEDGAEQLRDAWLARLPDVEDDPFALLNASMALAMTDSEQAVALAEAATRLEPRFAPFLGGQRVRHAMVHGMKPAAARAALDELRAAAENLDEPGRLEVYGAMVELAGATGLADEARIAAGAALGMDTGVSPFGGDVHHRAHTVLGMLAIREDDTDAAAEHFRASLRGPWSAQAAQLGACEDLAELLLDAGRADAVIAAIEEVEADWPEARETPWRDRIARGDLFGRRLFLD
jgi:hypothetical protein